MNKYINILLGVALSMASVSCSSDEVETTVDAPDGYLQVELAPLSREIVDGDVLPDSSKFKISCYGAVREASYVKGDVTLNEPLLLSREYDYVYAIYPAMQSNTQISNLASKQYALIQYNGDDTDYMVGKSERSVNGYSPKAYIKLHHAMSRVKINLKFAPGFDKSPFECGAELVGIPSGVCITPDGQVYENEYVFPLRSRTIFKDHLAVDETYSYDLIVCPAPHSYNRWIDVYSEIGNFQSPIIQEAWEPGMMYTYNVTVSPQQEVGVVIEKVEITEWKDGGSYDLTPIQ